MSLFSALADSVRATSDLARSGVDRVRLEAKAKTLERRHTDALTALGRRVRELAVAGDLSDDRLTTEIAGVASAEMQIAACQAEIDEIAARIAPKPAPETPVDSETPTNTSPSVGNEASAAPIDEIDPPPTADRVDAEASPASPPPEANDAHSTPPSTE